MAIGALSAVSRRSAVSTSAVPMVSVCRASLILQARDFGDQPQRGLAHEVLLRDAAAQPLVDVEIGEQERRAEPRVATAQAAIGRRQLADLVRHVRRLLAALVGEHLDHRVLARHQEPAPIGRDLAPDLSLRALPDERALGAVARDQVLVLENAERLPDGGARHAAFGGQVVDGRDLLCPAPKGPNSTRRRNRLASWM